MKTDLEEFKSNLESKEWRLQNLYWIIDVDGNRIPFRMNKCQKKLFDNLHTLNVIPKARQLGMCLDPKTKILTADLRWISISDIEIGTEVISVDENSLSRGKGRRMKTGIVQGKIVLERMKYRIDFDDGSHIICTGQHPWLSRRVSSEYKWRSIENKNKKKLKIGTKIRRITNIWNEANLEDYWIAGMIDGEGSMANKNRKGASISISQVDGKVWDRLLAYAKSNNYNYRVEVDRREAGSSSKLGNKPVNKLVFSRIDEVLRLMGVTRPTRFIGNRFYDDREMPVNNSYSTIINITPLGIGKVIDLQTSEGTYIAEGLVSHNTTFIQIFALDETLFKFKNSGVIAHTREDSEKFFDKKIKFAWDNLPEEIRNAVKLDTDSAKELKFIRRKGDMMEEASISVGTSLRSSTNQILHISELSSVDEKFPEKAKEIMSGALNTVQAKKGNYVFNESTGKVPYGKFYDTVQEAKKNVGKELTVMDYKLHFFPWWEDMKYTLEGEITIPDELNSYFKRLKDEEDITLTREQKNWYYKKSLEQKDDMKREFPSTITECFTADMEGSYYGKWMDEVYQENRIMNVPYTTGIPVDTYWDLGMNDTNVIIFAQQVDLEVRILDCYSMNGEGLEHYANYLKMLMMERGYVYGQHYAPHDIKVRELGTGKSRYETAMSLGITFNIVDPRRGLSIQDGIDCVRNIFKKFYFDEGKTKVLTDALVKYRKDYDDKLGVFKNHPVHDDSSNYADAMRYMAIALRDKGVYVPDKEEVQWIEEQSGEADIINNY